MGCGRALHFPITATDPARRTIAHANAVATSFNACESGGTTMNAAGGETRPAAAISAALRNSALFADAADTTVTDLAAAARVRKLARGQVLLVEGESPTSMFVVQSGLLKVFRTSLDGSEPTISVLFAGDHAGEIALLDGRQRSASVAAMRNSVVIEIPRSAFLAGYATDGALSRTIVIQLAHRLRATSERLGDLAVLDLGARLAKHLVAQARRSLAEGASLRFDLMLSQAEIGQLLGGARQSINQLLSGLERDRLIAIDGRYVTLLDPGKLALRSDLVV
jgi:CRP/FNR family transcriptional regulator, cyclic AMP receptor protein